MKIDNPNNYEITEKYTIKSVVTHTETDKTEIFAIQWLYKDLSACELHAFLNFNLKLLSNPLFNYVTDM